MTGVTEYAYYTGEGYTSSKATVVRLFCPLLESVYSKGKELTPNVSKVLPFRTDPFQKGLSVQDSKQEVTKISPL